MTDALQVEGLQKSYGKIAVLKGVGFSVRRGEIFGLLGVNGAGKTTALECIEGLRPPRRRQGNAMRQDRHSVAVGFAAGVHPSVGSGRPVRRVEQNKARQGHAGSARGV